jgi:hypothetical protein
MCYVIEVYEKGDEVVFDSGYGPSAVIVYYVEFGLESEMARVISEVVMSGRLALVATDLLTVDDYDSGIPNDTQIFIR